MEINRRSDYACRIIRAAYFAGDRYVSIAEVSETEDIPYAFARSIQHELVHAGLLKTVRGAKGGLTLACDPSTTTVYDVLSALDGEPHLSPCSSDPSFCEKCGECQYNRVWRKAEAIMQEYFGSITLDKLFAGGDCIGCELVQDGVPMAKGPARKEACDPEGAQVQQAGDSAASDATASDDATPDATVAAATAADAAVVPEVAPLDDAAPSDGALGESPVLKSLVEPRAQLA